MASFFAKTSYAAYLTHHWVAYLIFAAFGIERSLKTFSGVATTVASLAATFGLCALSYRYFERPLIEFSHRRFRFAKSPVREAVRGGQASSLGRDEATMS